MSSFCTTPPAPRDASEGADFSATQGRPHLATTWRPHRHEPLLTTEDMPDRFFVEPFVNGSVAPIGQGLDIAPEELVAARVLVIAIEGDRIEQPRFHAEALAAALPPGRLAGFVSVPGHHHGFIAPFPEWLTSKEDIPVAEDPAGFDRPAFIEHVNRLVVDFFVAPSNP